MTQRFPFFVALMVITSLGCFSERPDEAAPTPSPVSSADGANDTVDQDDTSTDGNRVATGMVAQESPSIEEIVLFDLDGNQVRPLSESQSGSEPRSASAFVFVRTDCPISNRYAPELRRLVEQYGERDIDFTLVYPSADESPEMIRRHLGDFSLPARALRDPNHALVDWVGAEVTPEAAVLDATASLVYRGRIDDTYMSFSTQRAEPTRRDLVLALDAVLAGQLPPADHQPAVGCAIPPRAPAMPNSSGA